MGKPSFGAISQLLQKFRFWAPQTGPESHKTRFWPYILNQIHYGHGILFLSWGSGPPGAIHSSRPTFSRHVHCDFLGQAPNFGVTQERGPQSSPLIASKPGLELQINPGVDFPWGPGKTAYPRRIWLEPHGVEHTQRAQGIVLHSTNPDHTLRWDPRSYGFEPPPTHTHTHTPTPTLLPTNPTNTHPHTSSLPFLGFGCGVWGCGVWGAGCGVRGV